MVGLAVVGPTFETENFNAVPDEDGQKDEAAQEEGSCTLRTMGEALI